ncbi:urease subunit beta [Brachybacterium hainanense]|uniref:Urease subunit beta n=1 Tax=Brachybacterium hainanense TaxID=1541174 RepID=A0ABV6RCL2_9MICO
MRPGEIRVADAPYPAPADAPRRVTLLFVNDGDRPIQIGSHLHLPEANPALAFDREAAHGHRLDIPAGTSVRFEPGVSRDLACVPLAGTRYATPVAGGEN